MPEEIKVRVSPQAYTEKAIAEKNWNDKILYKTALDYFRKMKTLNYQKLADENKLFEKV